MLIQTLEMLASTLGLVSGVVAGGFAATRGVRRETDAAQAHARATAGASTR